MNNTIPLGYKRVEYLESTGTQYIDTNYIPVQGDNLEFKNVSINQENFGALFSAGTGNYLLILIMNLEHFNYFKYFATGSAVRFYNNTLNNATIKIENEKIYINDILKSTSNYEGEVNTSLNIFRRADNTSYINAKMGEIIITNNNTLVRDYIPVLNENNEAGLYDLVNKQFYGNSGTGSFQYGNIIPEGTIAEKFNYSLEVKELIKDGINYLGGNATDETTLKEYRDELDSVYNKLPKVSNSTASDNVILYPTLKGRIDSTMYGQIGQDTTNGKNKLIYPYKETTKTANGLTFTDNGDGSITINGTSTAKTYFNLSNITLPAGQYFAKVFGTDSVTMHLLGSYFSVSTTKTINEETTYDDNFIQINSGATLDNVTIYMLVMDNSIDDKSYEPYTGRNIFSKSKL